jgi:hypothetical protein
VSDSAPPLDAPITAEDADGVLASLAPPPDPLALTAAALRLAFPAPEAGDFPFAAMLANSALDGRSKLLVLREPLEWGFYARALERLAPSEGALLAALRAAPSARDALRAAPPALAARLATAEGRVELLFAFFGAGTGATALETSDGVRGWASRSEALGRAAAASLAGAPTTEAFASAFVESIALPIYIGTIERRERIRILVRFARACVRELEAASDARAAAWSAALPAVASVADFLAALEDEALKCFLADENSDSNIKVQA